MGITANKLRLELIKGKEFCYYGFALENPSGTLEACNLAIAAGAVTMAFCVIFSIIAAISALRGSGADTKSAHLAEFILMTILELLWIATLVFLVYLLVAKTDLDLDNSTRSLSEGTTNALIVVVFCALSAGFTVSCLFAFDFPADPRILFCPRERLLNYTDLPTPGRIPLSRASILSRDCPLNSTSLMVFLFFSLLVDRSSCI